MLGLNLLVRLGRGFLAGPLTDSGLLPAAVYRHLALVALEAEDFPEALSHLKWAGDPLLVQVLILRLRLLSHKHREQRRTVEELLARKLDPAREEKGRAILAQEGRALKLLAGYELEAMALLPKGGRAERVGAG